MIYNLRQLAEGQTTIDGRRLKKNSIIRSGYIEPNPENREFLNNMKIRTIFDFRSNFEIEAKPNFATINVEYYPLGHEVNEELMKANQIKFQAPDMVAFYQTGFEKCVYLNAAVRDIVLNPRNILYHCTAGKDRTGIFSIILMTLLGYSQEQINAHYLQIDRLFIEHTRDMVKQLMPELSDNQVEDLITVKQEYFDAFYNPLAAKYGSFENFVMTSFNLEEEQVQKFKDYYLE